MPRLQLLGILNDRLRADIGPDAPPYTIEQLHAEIAALPRIQAWRRSRVGRSAQAAYAGQTRRHARSDQRADHQRLRCRVLALSETSDAAEGHSPSAGGGLTNETFCHPPRRHARGHAQSRRNADHPGRVRHHGAARRRHRPARQRQDECRASDGRAIVRPRVGQCPDRPRERARIALRRCRPRSGRASGCADQTRSAHPRGQRQRRRRIRAVRPRHSRRRRSAPEARLRGDRRGPTVQREPAPQQRDRRSGRHHQRVRRARAQAGTRPVHHRPALHRHPAAHPVRQQEPDPDRLAGRPDRLVGPGTAVQGLEDRIRRPQCPDTGEFFCLSRHGVEKSGCRWRQL